MTQHTLKLNIATILTNANVNLHDSDTTDVCASGKTTITVCTPANKSVMPRKVRGTISKDDNDAFVLELELDEDPVETP